MSALANAEVTRRAFGQGNKDHARNLQVQDDADLLKLMMADMRSAPTLYQPTNYWKNYEKKLVPELVAVGLRDFRRSRNFVFESLGGSDLPPASRINCFKPRLLNNRVSRRIPLWTAFLTGLNSSLNSVFSPFLTYDVALDDIRYMCYEIARLKGEQTGAKSVDELEASLMGNPEDVFRVGDRVYTLSLLKYYLCYAYCCAFVDFKKVGSIVELGSGSGKQIEVIKKLHPDICFFLFDIPPQLYICEQYLRSVFPGDVVSYRETRDMNAMPAVTEGKIFMFGSWKIPIIEETKVDLFWNEASLQEMEPDVVANYLKYVNKAAQTAFLCEVMQGKEVARKGGDHGVLKPTTLEHYKGGLKDFEMIDLSPYLHIPKMRTLQFYSYSFWQK